MFRRYAQRYDTPNVTAEVKYSSCRTKGYIKLKNQHQQIAKVKGSSSSSGSGGEQRG